MSVTAPQTAMRHVILDALNEEFAGEIVFRNDKIHASNGRDQAIGGCYPGEDFDRPQDQLVLEMTCMVQLFMQWDAKIDPNLQVSPDAIENAAERARRALEAVEPSGTADASAHLWDCHVSRISYEDDPSGNRSRCLITVSGRAQNSALVATLG